MDYDNDDDNRRSYEEKAIQFTRVVDAEIVRLCQAARQCSEEAALWRDQAMQHPESGLEMEVQRLERKHAQHLQQESDALALRQTLCLNVMRRVDQYIETFPESIVNPPLRGHATKSDLSSTLTIDSWRRNDDDEILRAIMTPTLRSIVIGANVPNDHIEKLGLFLGAAANNPSIHSLTIANRRIPCDFFWKMMMTTVSLTELSLIHCNKKYTTRELGELTIGFRLNESLLKLRLNIWSNNTVAAILNGFHAKSRLKELQIHAFDSQSSKAWTALCDCLCALQSLFHLSLVAFDFEAENMEALATRLFRQDDSQTPSASFTKLTLNDCSFSRAGFDHCLGIMQTPIHEGITPTLRELYIEGYSCSDSRLNGGQIATILSPLRVPVDGAPRNYGAKWYTTIGSQLSTLSLNIAFDEDFVAAFIAHASQIRLQCLLLKNLDCQDTALLSRFLNCFTCLRDLRLGRRIYERMDVLGMLSEHTHIHSVTVLEMETCADIMDVPVVYTDEQTHVIQAYCERNVNLDPLCQAMLESKRSDVFLYPSLVQATRTIPNMQICYLRTSLVSLGEAIGPNLNS